MYEAGHLLRYMIYVGRSSIAGGFTEQVGSTVFKIGRHHAKIAVDIWLAETSTHMGMPKGRDLDPAQPKAVILMGVTKCEGAIVICPPGHGKTECASHWAGRKISENPYEQGWVIHAQEALAAQTLAYVANLFDMTTAVGRRNRALFPDLPTRFHKRNSKCFWLDLPHRTKQPTMSASGVRSKRSGADASFILFDDPVDQREAEQEQERKRTYDLINGTWLTRLRGKSTFHLTTTTLWHPDDANCRRIQLARDGKLSILVSIQGTGGPRNVPAFKAVWPEMYNQEYIKRKYESMRNPTLFSAAYMANPVAESLKIVKKLRFYLPDEGHARFLAGADKYLSLDPAATNRQGSDKAGILYAAGGLYSWVTLADGTEVSSSEYRLRILDANQIHATQSELVEYAFGHSLIKDVDYIVVETRSGFQGIAEMFENQHGIKPIRLDPGNKSKDIRLRAAAPALEDSNEADGIRAVVEFPGTKDEAGNIIPDERYNWLYDQILNFGFSAEDHCVDAVSQLVNYLAPELMVGKGAVSRAAVKEVLETGSPKARAWVKKFLGQSKEGEPAPLEDARWMLSNQGAA